MRFLIDDNGEPRQYVDEAKQLTIVRRQMTEADFRQYAYHGFCRPFDIMGEEPLLRVELITTTEGPRYMLLDIHHLVSDGTSFLVLFPQRDLPLAYEGKPLPVQAPAASSSIHSRVEEKLIWARGRSNDSKSWRLST